MELKGRSGTKPGSLLKSQISIRTFTPSRSGNKNDGCHVEQKDWSVVRRAVGYHRYDTPPKLELLNQIYVRLRLQTNFFSPQQRLLEKHRQGAKVTKKTPPRRPLPEDPQAGILT